MQPPSNSLKKKWAEIAKTYHEQLSGSAGLAYFEGRGFTLQHAITHGIGYVRDPAPGHEHNAGRLSIPFVSPTGIVQIKFRCIEPHDCDEGGCIKYFGMNGAGAWMYNTRAFLADSPVIAITEGEMDALAVQCHTGIPAIGFPGTNAALADGQAKNQHWYRAFTGYSRVLVVGDGDKAGRKAAQGIAKNITQADVLHLPDGEDANSLLTKPRGIERFREMAGLEDTE